MVEEKVKKFAGGSALASGALGVLGFVMLALFFAVYLSPSFARLTRGIDGFHVFGRLSDGLPIPAAVAGMGMVASFFVLQRRQAQTWSLLALLAGLAGYAGVILTNMLFINEKINLEKQTLYGSMTWGALGVWLLIVLYLAWRQNLLPSRVTTAGVVIGVARIIAFGLMQWVAFFTPAGVSATLSFNPETLPLPLLIGSPASLLTLLGPPVWEIWLAGTLLRSARKARLEQAG